MRLWSKDILQGVATDFFREGYEHHLGHCCHCRDAADGLQCGDSPGHRTNILRPASMASANMTLIPFQNTLS